MIALYLFLLHFSCDGTVLQEGPWRVVAQERGFCITDLAQTQKSPRHAKGEVIALNQNGVLFQREERWFFLDFALDDLISLKPPGEPFLQSRLAWMTGPAFFNQTHLMRWQGNNWQKVKLSVFIEYKSRGPVPGSKHGLNLILPQIFQSGPTDWVIYQPKTGELSEWNGNNKAGVIDFGRDRRAVPVGRRLAWLGAPRENRASLTVTGSSFELGDSVTIDNLNKHSLVIVRRQGAWILTFPSGFRDGLKSWDSGRLPLKAHYLSVDGGGKLSSISHAMSKMPIDFDLTTSASGSPRLNVTPMFSVKPIYRSEWMAVIANGTLFAISPAKGVSSRRLKKFKAPLTSLVRNKADLTAMDAEGNWQLVVEGLF